MRNNYLFENCRNVKKTVRWTVFSSAGAAMLRGTTGSKRISTIKKQTTLPFGSVVE